MWFKDEEVGEQTHQMSSLLVKKQIRWTFGKYWPGGSHLILEESKMRWVHTQPHTESCRHTHPMEYYSATKNKETMLCAATWRNLDSLFLSELSQTEKDKNCIILLTCAIKKNCYKRIYKTEIDLPY